MDWKINISQFKENINNLSSVEKAVCSYCLQKIMV